MKVARMRIAPIAFALVVGACAAGAAQMSGPGGDASPARVCLDVSQIANRVALSDTQIRLDMNNGDRWINTLKSQCPGLRFNNAFSWDVTGGQVCSNTQTIHVLDQNTPCQLGDFSRAP